MQVTYLERPLKLGGQEWSAEAGTCASGSHEGKWDTTKHHHRILAFAHAAVDVDGIVYEFQPKNGFKKSLLKGEYHEGKVEVGKSTIDDFPKRFVMGITDLSHESIHAFIHPVKAYNLFRNNCQSFAQALVKHLIPTITRVRRRSTPTSSDSSSPTSSSTRSGTPTSPTTPTIRKLSLVDGPTIRRLSVVESSIESEYSAPPQLDERPVTQRVPLRQCRSPSQMMSLATLSPAHKWTVVAI